MNGSQRYTGETTGGFMERSGARSVPLEWRQEWFTTVCLMITLAAIIFLMLLSIYLVVTKPEPSSIPGDNGGERLRRSHADRFAAVPGQFESDGIRYSWIPAGSA